MQYRYFISFFKGKSEEEKTFGQTILSTSNVITGINQIQDIEKYLTKELGVKVAVISFSKFQEVCEDVNNFN